MGCPFWRKAAPDGLPSAPERVVCVARKKNELERKNLKERT
jgi:hypothetical protein